MNHTMIVCAAIRSGNQIVCGARHFDMVMHSVLPNLCTRYHPEEQGFIDNHGRFHDRHSALQIALAAGQINTRRPKTNPTNLLFSEDLY